MAQVSIFLSAVSAEFRSYRDALRHDLERSNVTVKVQEDFIPTGTETLDKLDDYIRHCDVVIHLVGDMTGAWAQTPSLDLIRSLYSDLSDRLPPLRDCLEPDAPSLSYTQWEAWLALYHNKVLIIATPMEGAARDNDYLLIEEQRLHQQKHLEHLRAHERYPEIHFANADDLAKQVALSTLLDILAGNIKLERASLCNRRIRERFAEDAQKELDRHLRETSFVSLGLEQGTFPKENGERPEAVEDTTKAKSHGRQWQSLDLKQLLPLGGKQILSADAGTGKTTLLLWLAAESVKNAAVIPIYLSCTAFERWIANPWNLLKENLISRYRAEFKDTDLRDCLEQAHEEGRIVFLLDGLDQIKSNDCSYSDLAKIAFGIAAGNAVLIAARPSAVLALENEQDIAFIRLRPFSDK